MPIRRTLNQALRNSNLSEAAIAFVHGEMDQLRETIHVSGNSNTAFDSQLPRGTTGALPESGRGREQPSCAEIDRSIPGGSVSMTFRLPSELSTRLLRVSLDRKLKRNKPFTQQDIIAEALALWLNKQDCAD